MNILSRLTRTPTRRSVALGFVVRLARVEVLPSALRHGVDRADIEHAARNAMAMTGPGREYQS